MAELFGIDKSGISRHIANIFKDEELQQDKTVAKIATVANRGIRVAKKFVFSMIIRTFTPSVPTKPLNEAQMRGAFCIYTFTLKIR